MHLLKAVSMLRRNNLAQNEAELEVLVNDLSSDEEIISDIDEDYVAEELNSSEEEIESDGESNDGLSLDLEEEAAKNEEILYYSKVKTIEFMDQPRVKVGRLSACNVIPTNQGFRNVRFIL